jgi:2,4-dienoyl-CoA reductase (NADPH2)
VPATKPKSAISRSLPEKNRRGRRRPAGLAFATTAARRGHQVTLFDAASEIGGQFNVAKQVPGKEEFYETIRYFNKQIQLTGVTLALGKKVSAEDLQDFDEVALATGITPRLPEIEGIQHAKVLGYLDVLRDKKPVGKSVAIIGAGGIGFDTAEYLCHSGTSASLDPAKFFAEWGVDTEYRHAGGLREAEIEAPARQVFLLRKPLKSVTASAKPQAGYTAPASKTVEYMIAGVTYRRIDDAGLHITVDGQEQVLPVDNVIICAGQEPNRALQQGLLDAGKTVHLIGGADVAAELDAKRAINQGVRLAAVI